MVGKKKPPLKIPSDINIPLYSEILLEVPIPYTSTSNIMSSEFLLF